MNTSHDIVSRISSSVCSTCHGAAPGFKCPACGASSMVFDPTHWRTCVKGTKMQAECAKCKEAEEKCTCVKA